MLRIAVLGLVVINLLVFGWTRFTTDSKPELRAVASAPGHEKPQPPPCATLGPFHDTNLADQGEAAIGRFGWQVQRRASNQQVSDGWWVYITTASAAAQSKALSTIRRSGMDDAFAMPDDTSFRVSAGLFSNQQRAEDRAKRVERLKLDAVVEERHKDQPVIWLDVPGIARATLGDGRLKDSGLPLDQLRIEDCPAPAPKDDTAPTAAPAAQPANTQDADPLDPAEPVDPVDAVTNGAKASTGVAVVTAPRDSTARRV